MLVMRWGADLHAQHPFRQVSKPAGRLVPVVTHEERAHTAPLLPQEIVRLTKKPTVHGQSGFLL